MLEEFGLSDPSVAFLNILSFQEENIGHKPDDGESDQKKRANWDKNEKEIIDFSEDIPKPDFRAEEGKEEDHGFQEHAGDLWKLAGQGRKREINKWISQNKSIGRLKETVKITCDSESIKGPIGKEGVFHFENELVFGFENAQSAAFDLLIVEIHFEFLFLNGFDVFENVL